MAQRMLKVQMDYALSELRSVYYDRLGPRPSQFKEDAPTVEDIIVDKLDNAEIDIAEILEEAIVKYRRNRAVSKYNRKSIAHLLCEQMEKYVSTSDITPAVNPEYEKWLIKEGKLSKAFKEAKDELILGDAGHALKLLEKFRKIKV
jgi:hypothetical protein